MYYCNDDSIYNRLRKNEHAMVTLLSQEYCNVKMRSRGLYLSISRLMKMISWLSYVHTPLQRSEAKKIKLGSNTNEVLRIQIFLLWQNWQNCDISSCQASKLTECLVLNDAVAIVLWIQMNIVCTYLELPQPLYKVIPLAKWISLHETHVMVLEWGMCQDLCN